MAIKKFSSRRRATRNKEQPSSSLAVLNSDHSLEVCHNQPSSAKRANSRVPEPQFQRILARHMNGESVRSISRSEGRARETIARVINSDDVKNIVQRMRSQVYGMAGDAIDAVRHALREQKDGRVGYRLLIDIGAIPRMVEAESNAVQAMQPEAEKLTPYEQAAAQDETGRVNPIQLALVRIAQERSSQFGLSMPTVDEMWRNRTVAALINEMTLGRTLSISLSDSVELNRLKRLAEDVLRGKRAMTDLEIVSVRKKYSD